LIHIKPHSPFGDQPRTASLVAEPVRSIDMNQGTARVSVGVDLDDAL
jgi:hypothetical protein